MSHHAARRAHFRHITIILLRAERENVSRSSAHLWSFFAELSIVNQNATILSSDFLRRRMSMTLLERVENTGLRLHLAPATIECYQRWIKEFLTFHRSLQGEGERALIGLEVDADGG
jgi:hypothetical protein